MNDEEEPEAEAEIPFGIEGDVEAGVDEVPPNR